jgi:hypothetical protein
VHNDNFRKYNNKGRSWTYKDIRLDYLNSNKTPTHKEVIAELIPLQSSSNNSPAVSKKKVFVEEKAIAANISIKIRKEEDGT